jgi:hypothetical protein
MIIHRVARAIRAQDWSTITIELIVVVVGIFLGLQVDDWNERRKDAAREQVYLQRLLADIDEMISRHEAHEERARSKLNSLVVSFDALRSCTLTAEAVEPFEEILLNHHGLPRLEVVRSSFDEMVASGALAGIADPRLKRKISEVYSEAVSAQQFIEYFSADLGRASDIIWRHVSFDLAPGDKNRLRRWEEGTPEGHSLSVTYDFDALCNAPAFRNALVEVYDSTKDRLGVGTEFSNQLGLLRGLIEEALGK